MVRYTGHCHCKEVSYEITLAENETFQLPPEYDFCTDCRRVSGSLLTGWLFILESQLTWLTGHDKLTLYRSSENVERLFCSICGCQFTYKSLSRNRDLVAQNKLPTIDVALGTLNEEILKYNPDIAPWRYAWYTDILNWMKRILPSEQEIKELEQMQK